MIKNLVSIITDILHILIILITYIIFVLPKKNFKKYGKWLLLMNSLIPLHWVFFDNFCLSSLINIKLGKFQESQTTSPFSEKYLKWLYSPIMKFFGWPWDSTGLDKMVTLHWIINIILAWYYCFYY
jgi:hypothetical protein